MSTRIVEVSDRAAAESRESVGEDYARIESPHRMPSFLMSIPTDTDLWMFITSRGGLTAGRVDADGSLFPYETVDKLHDGPYHTGPITLLRVRREGEAEVLWEPLSAGGDGGFRVERTLYKSPIGNRIVFEELNLDLGLLFRYRWAGCNEFGWVRTAVLENLGGEPVSVSLLDGLRNVLPWGAPLSLYQQSSSLVDAYRRTDGDPETGLAAFSLTAKVTDRPEPAEVLRANAVWCTGLPNPGIHLSLEAVEAFRRGDAMPVESVLTGRRGNYLVHASVDLGPGERARWHLAADVGKSHVELAALRDRLLRKGDPGEAIEVALRAADESLVGIVAAADGLQLTGDGAATMHHFANVLFNVMRGGTFHRNYAVPTADFGEFLRARNPAVAERHRGRIAVAPRRDHGA